jgi:hypothetical protein
LYFEAFEKKRETFKSSFVGNFQIKKKLIWNYMEKTFSEYSFEHLYKLMDPLSICCILFIVNIKYRVSISLIK